MRVQRFGHAGVEVGDLAAAETFYRNVFGFEVWQRYPEDGEVLLRVGQRDHLLLHSPSADPRAPAGAAAGAGGASLNHVAFELVEGHREVRSVQAELQGAGIPFEEEDHFGDPAVYFRDPDGNLLEVYAAPGSTPRFADDAERAEAARRFVYGHARPVDRAIFEHRYDGAPAARAMAALEAYRNPDGGFGHALEPDVRAPASQPLHTLTALELLREAGIQAPELASGCCEFLAAAASADAMLPALLPGALDYPAAAHWQGDFALEPRFSWTFGCVAALAWHGADHPWFHEAQARCRDALAHTEADGAHELLYLFRFASTVLDGDERTRELARRRQALAGAAFFVAETPVARYGLTPLHFAPGPDAPARQWFDNDLIEAHLDDLLDAQQGDGGWPIRFEPPTQAAAIEWRGRWTLEARDVLRAYGRIR